MYPKTYKGMNYKKYRMNVLSPEEISKTQLQPDKPTPLGNIRVLEGQLEKLKVQKKELEEKLRAYNDKEINMKNVEEMEKLEEEWEFLNGYHNTLRDQLVVIMNENNVVIPPKEENIQSIRNIPI